MSAPDILGEFLLLIAMAAVGVALFERLRLPAIAGFLVMGALVGPGGLELVDDPERVRSLAELGVVFLLFEIGLELPLERLRRLWRHALVAGGLQVLATVMLVWLAGRALGLSNRAALLMGALVAMSSTALVMRLLADRGEVDAPQGQIAVGILLFQDLCIVPFLLLVPVLAAEDPSGARMAGMSLARSGMGLAAFFVVARFVLPPLLDRAARLGSRDLFSLLAFLIVVGSAVAAERIGLTLAVGAFLGGLVVSASPYAHQLFAEVLPLRGVLLGLFFTAVGMLFDPLAAARHAHEVLAYVTGVILLKAAVVAAIVALGLREGLRIGVVTGLSLAQTGEFSFVLAAAAATAGLLSEPLQQTFVAGSVVTLLATPFLVAWAPRVGAWISSGADRLASPAPEVRPALAHHVVLIGFGLANRQLARVLSALGKPYVGADANAISVREALGRGEPVIYGDATRRPILERLGVQRAQLAVVALTDSVTTLRVVRMLRQLNPEATILARTRYVLDVDELQSAGANLVLAEEFESTLGLLARTLQAAGIPEGAVARFAEELREEGYELMRVPSEVALDPWLTELLEQVATQWVEVPEGGVEGSLRDLEVRARTGVNVLAVDRGGRTSPNPEPGYVIRPGDRLLVVGSSEAMDRLRSLLAGARDAPP